MSPALQAYAQNTRDHTTPSPHANATSGLETGAPLLDPSRFSIDHAVSFSMSGAQGRDVASQSVYSTMMEYRFSAPLTLNLNFDMPIHSSMSSAANLGAVEQSPSAYLSTVPFNVSLSWQPRENLFMRFSFSHGGLGYGDDTAYGFSPVPRQFRVTDWNDL
jgi:hypothetical protein